MADVNPLSYQFHLADIERAARATRRKGSARAAIPTEGRALPASLFPAILLRRLAALRPERHRPA